MSKDTLITFLTDNAYIIPLVDIIEEDKTYITNVIINDTSAFLLSTLKKKETFIEYVKNNKLISSRLNVHKIFFS